MMIFGIVDERKGIKIEARSTAFLANLRDVGKFQV